MISICDLLKLAFHSLVLVTVAVPLFLAWSTWRLFTGLAALPHHVYQVGDDMVFHFCQRLLIMLLEGVAGCKVLFYGDIADVVNKKERAFYIVNHQSSFDWIAVNLLAERTGSAGSLRYIVKQSIQSVPLLGFYFHQHGCIYINRQHLNHFKMKQGLYYLQNKNIQSSIVLFPEGNRFIPGKEDVIKMSTEFATSQDVFTGRCGLIHMHIKRTPIDKLPGDDNGLKKFIFDAFYEKDALLSAYYESDETPAEFQNPVSVPCEHLHGQFVMLVTVFVVSLFLLTSGGRACLWMTWLYGSIFGYSWLGMNSVA
ncbi:1-acyl-sn-glycerol-3-phosphate acyltransferase epsilon-like isoform X2 [Amblyomma americanum]